MKRFALYFIFLIFFLVPSTVHAQSKSFVTIVNPVRVSPNSNDPIGSLKAEYHVVKGLPVTWLFTYDALGKKDLTDLAKSFEPDQELGIFLEIGKPLCDAAGVNYDDSYSWHHPANIFLSGYSQSDRVKLVDSVFEKFRNVFGYYPKSVGAWWIDPYSLEYMQNKYGIKANLGLADQYATDGYRVWGSPWSTPFYPSKLNSLQPGSADTKLKIVTLQWAPRDPLNGYINSYYSTQDYLQTKENLGNDYFRKLVDLYTDPNENKFGQITVGLESDLDKKAYSGEFNKQIDYIRDLNKKGTVSAVTASEFTDWYINNFPSVSPVQLIESDDLLDKNIKVYWYNSSRFRAGLRYDKDNAVLEIFDLKTYPKDFRDPYYFELNKDFRLLEQAPSLIDEISMNNTWKIDSGKLMNEKRSDDIVELDFEKGKLLLNEKGFRVSFPDTPFPDYLIKNPLIDYNSETKEFTAKEKYLVGESGYVFRWLKPETANFLQSKRAKVMAFLFSLCLFMIVLKIFNSKTGNIYKSVLLTLIMLLLVGFSRTLFYKYSIKYYVSQSEMDALTHLKMMPPGKVMVYKHKCLGCGWNTPEKPAVFDDLRGYVQKYSGKEIVYNSSVFEAKDQIESANEFNKTGAKYIYVVSYGNYKKKVPFSPGDLGIKLVYENANSQVWQKK